MKSEQAIAELSDKIARLARVVAHHIRGTKPEDVNDLGEEAQIIFHECCDIARQLGEPQDPKGTP